MKRFRYEDCGNKWFKGNTHVHSTCSDGGKTFHELANMYAGAGYDFLFRTDHWSASDVETDGDSYPLLWLDGLELDGNDGEGGDYHVVCLGKVSGISRDMGFKAAMESARSQGALLILAHPAWMGNSEADANRWNFHGVEIYNHVCNWLNGKSDGLTHWNMMMRGTPGTLAFAADDTHASADHPGWNGAWIVVNAPQLSRQDVMQSVRDGRFYSSQGPEIHSIERRGSGIRITTSPARFIRMAGPGACGKRTGSFEGDLLTEASFELSDDWGYAYLEIEDGTGRKAWTNTLLVPEQ